MTHSDPCTYIYRAEIHEFIPIQIFAYIYTFFNFCIGFLSPGPGGTVSGRHGNRRYGQVVEQEEGAFVLHALRQRQPPRRDPTAHAGNNKQKRLVHTVLQTLSGCH